MTDQPKQALIEQTVKQVSAILTESNVQPRTGRTLANLGKIDSDMPLPKLIDHTMLRADATARDIEMLCLQAISNNFASVCVNSAFVPLASEILRKSDVKVIAAIGLPLGAQLPQVKAYETEQAIIAGAEEVDMMIHLGALKSRHLVALYEDISDVATICHNANDDGGYLCKVVIETSLLSEVEIIMASQICRMAGADFVVTSTGYTINGATIDGVRLIRAVVGDGVGVKASGGIRSLDEAQAMIDAGANRIGTQYSVRIAHEVEGTFYTGYMMDEEGESAS